MNYDIVYNSIGIYHTIPWNSMHVNLFNYYIHHLKLRWWYHKQPKYAFEKLIWNCNLNFHLILSYLLILVKSKKFYDQQQTWKQTNIDNISDKLFTDIEFSPKLFRVDKLSDISNENIAFRHYWCNRKREKKIEIMPKTNIDCHEKRCKSFIFKYTENLHPVVFYCVRDTAYSRRDFFIYTIKMCTYMKIPHLNNCIFYFIPTIFLSRRMNKK